MKDVNQKLMRCAGFKRLHDSTPDYVMWERGAIRLVVDKSIKLSLKKLIGYIINQAIHRTQQNAAIRYDEFATENK